MYASQAWISSRTTTLPATATWRMAACLARALKQKQLERQLEVQLTPEVVEQLQATMANLPAPEPEEA